MCSQKVSLPLRALRGPHTVRLWAVGLGPVAQGSLVPPLRTWVPSCPPQGSLCVQQQLVD